MSPATPRLAVGANTRGIPDGPLEVRAPGDAEQRAVLSVTPPGGGDARRVVVVRVSRLGATMPAGLEPAMIERPPETPWSRLG